MIIDSAGTYQRKRLQTLNLLSFYVALFHNLILKLFTSVHFQISCDGLFEYGDVLMVLGEFFQNFTAAAALYAKRLQKTNIIQEILNFSGMCSWNL